MPSASSLRLALAAACLALIGVRELRRPAPLPVVTLAPSAQPVPAPSSALAAIEPDFAARMTPDDVARGAWALAGGAGPGLSPEQARAALPVAREAAALRSRSHALRTRRRAARGELRATGATLAAALVAAGWTPEAPR